MPSMPCRSTSSSQAAVAIWSSEVEPADGLGVRVLEVGVCALAALDL
jgi:hypothetical protein